MSESAYYFRIKTLLSFLKVGVNTNTVNIPKIVDWMDQVIVNPEDEALISKVRTEVNQFMDKFPITTH